MPEEYGTAELVKEFLEEADEHLHVLNVDLLAIEARIAAHEELPTDQLDEMFRAMHTLKGLSAMFDLASIRELSHQVESVFDRMRKHTLVPDRACLDMLFDSADVLQHALAAFAAGEAEDAELPETIARVAAFLEATGEEGPAPAATRVEGASEYARTRLQRAESEGLRGVGIRLRWGIELRLGYLRVRDVESALGPSGEVLEIRPLTGEVPEVEQIDPTKSDLTFEVVALTGWSDQEIADRLGVSASSISAKGPQAEVAASSSPAPSEPERSPAPSSDRRSGEDRRTGTERRNLGVGVGNAVRVDIRRLDDLVDLTGELVTARTRLSDLSAALLAANRKDETTVAMHRAVKDVSTLVNTLQASVLGLRMVPIGHAFSRFPRVVRDLAHSTGKEIRLELAGEDTELDKRVIEQIEDPLLHILRNAADHGIETPEVREAAGKPREGCLRLSARYEDNLAVVECADDGSGLNVERILAQAVADGHLASGETATPEHLAEIIMAPGFTTSASVTDVSGRGVGLDVVRRKTMELGGRVEVTSTPGSGTTFTLRLPLTMAIISALLVRASDQRFAIPLSAVDGVTRARPADVHRVQSSEVLDLRGETLPLIDLSTVLALGGARPQRRFFVVETSGDGESFGLAVDELLGQREIVVKGLEEAVGDTAGISGATILGDGTIVPILDVDELVRLQRGRVATRPERDADGGA